MENPTAPASPAPREPRAAAPTRNADGRAAITQRTSTSNASPNAEKNPTSVVRSPWANGRSRGRGAKLKTIWHDRSAGGCPDRVRRHERNDPCAESLAWPARDLTRGLGGAWWQRRRPRWPQGSSAKMAGRSGTTRRHHDEEEDEGREARDAQRPIALMSAADAAPVIMSDTISGIIVMRMALTQSVPRGVTKSAGGSAFRVPRAAMPAPRTNAATSATRTRSAFFHSPVTL